jgi:phage-related protein
VPQRLIKNSKLTNRQLNEPVKYFALEVPTSRAANVMKINRHSAERVYQVTGISQRCHELRIVDKAKTWRIIYRIDLDAIIIVDVFRKTTQQTPKRVIDDCRRRLKLYDALS